jgi:hypothetical protein
VNRTKNAYEAEKTAHARTSEQSTLTVERTPRVQRPTIAPEGLRERLLGQKAHFIAVGGESVIELFSKMVPAPGEEIPAEYEECPHCLGEMCETCLGLGVLDPCLSYDEKNVVDDLRAKELAFDLFAERQTPGQRHLFAVSIGRLKGEWLERWRREGRISEDDWYLTMTAAAKAVRPDLAEYLE